MNKGKSDSFKEIYYIHVHVGTDKTVFAYLNQ